MARTPEAAAQEERIDKKGRDLLEAFLDGKAAIDIVPLPGSDHVVAAVGAMGLLAGFSIRLRRDPA